MSKCPAIEQIIHAVQKRSANGASYVTVYVDKKLIGYETLTNKLYKLGYMYKIKVNSEHYCVTVNWINES